MREWRRREVLALAGLGLGARAFGAVQSPSPADQEPQMAETTTEREVPASEPGPLTTGPFAGMRWRVRYEFDEFGKRCQLRDFAMPTPKLGAARMSIAELDTNKSHAELLVTRDGGVSFVRQKLDREPLGLAVAGESFWLIYDDYLQLSLDGGVKWEKRLLPNFGLTNLYFATPQRGWAFGKGKVFYQTEDGVRTWKAVPESEQLELKSPETYLRSMAMLGSGAGMVLGDSTAQAASTDQGLDWMAPERAVKRKSKAGTTVLYTTMDSGKTWSARLASTLGTAHRVRMGPSRAAVVYQYADSFFWPSELFAVDLRVAASVTALRRKDLLLHDALPLDDGGWLAAATLVSGKLRYTPVPAKVRVLWSPDQTSWFEMKVDYRASGHAASFAPGSEGRFWLATDEGAILELAR